jgi:hypothetical protein
MSGWTPEMRETLWRAVDVDVTPLGEGQDLVITDDGEASAVPALLAAVLRGCSAGFFTLDEHQRRLKRGLKLKAEQRLISDVLRDLIKCGLLISQDEWLASGADRDHDGLAASRGWIVTIPSVSRPAQLARTLDHLRNIGGADWCEAVLVAGGRRGSGATTSSTPLGPRICTYTPSRLDAFVAHLARESGVSRRLLDYGLLPRAPHGIVDTGANRNLLQLLSVGRPVLSIDDDVDVRLVVPSAVVQGGRTVCHSPDVFSVWCFAELQQVLEACATSEPPGFPGKAAEFLGASPRRVLQQWRQQPGGLDASSVCAHLFRAAQYGTGRIGFVFPGVSGDPGWEDPIALLWRDAEDPSSDVNQGRAHLLRSRAAIRAPAKPTLYHGDEFLSTCYALDNSQLLPPFFPLGRGQDGMYGAVLALCFPEMFGVHLPECVVHDTGRPPYGESISTYVGAIRIAEILYACLLRTSDWPAGLDAAGRLNALGAWLHQLGNWNSPAFEDHIVGSLVRSRSAVLVQARARLGAVHGKPTDWMKAAAEYTTATEAVVIDMPACLDRALETMGVSIQQVQHWIRDYGELLQCWPAIRASAASYDALESSGELSCDTTH